jgi:hypothetical protein
MEKYFILNDHGKYYVDEGRATYDIDKALKIETLEKLITTVPIMKDWNWDYVVYEVLNGEIKKVDDKVWMDMHYKWKKENPKGYEKLYSASGFSNFVRTTSH